MKTLATIFTMMGYLLVFYSIAGGIAGMYDYEIKIKGAGMGVMDWGTAAFLMVLGALFLGGGLFWSKRIEKKEKAAQETV